MLVQQNKTFIKFKCVLTRIKTVSLALHYVYVQTFKCWILEDM